MNNVMTQFDKAAKHYKLHMGDILDAGRSEWGVDPYAWEEFTDMTPIEADLWACVRDVDAVFYPQYPIGKFFADFCNPVAMVVIECDGARWHKDKEKDDARQKAIEDAGFVVYRISGVQCKNEAFAKEFVQSIAFRHGLVRGSRDCCVAWDYKATRHVVIGSGDLKNINASAAIDKQPGLAVVRDGLHIQEAVRIAKAFNICHPSQDETANNNDQAIEKTN